jgi:hypothetical protein
VKIITNEVKPARSRGLPKFDSTIWLVIGIIFSAVVFGDNLWSLIADWGSAFLPFQLGRILGLILGLSLGIHCIDMMGYYRKHGRLGTDQRR